MGHQINCFENVVTVRLDGHVNALQVYQDLRQTLDQSGRDSPRLTVIIDVTLTGLVDTQTRATLYRAFQHQFVGAVGICGINQDATADMEEWIRLISRICKVAMNPTEADVRVALGLSSPAPKRQLTGMLAYLNKPPQH